MPIIEERFIPSKKNYAIDWNTFKITAHNQENPNTSYISVVVDAAWVTKKKGISYISKGTLHNSFRTSQPHDFTIKDFCEKFDSRYGGDHICVWDGEIMTTKSPIPLQEMVEYSKILDPILEDLPNVPQGYSGWCRLT